MPPSPLVPLLAHWRERPQRTWSVVVTVFGDAIGPRGGSVPLATLVELFAALGVDPGAVRTAMHRLVADGWTMRRRLGRTSAYSLTEMGVRTFTAAAGRIYSGGPPAWDGLVHLALMPQDRAALGAAGFAQASPGAWIGVAPPPATEPLTLRATGDAAAIQQLAARAWPLDRIAAAFARFVAAFAALPEWPPAEPVEAMAARTLLIHEYRRIVLQAPALPIQWLPAEWPGTVARELCARAYAALLPPSESWLTEHGLPPASPDLARRFAPSDP